MDSRPPGCNRWAGPGRAGDGIGAVVQVPRSPWAQLTSSGSAPAASSWAPHLPEAGGGLGTGQWPSESGAPEVVTIAADAATPSAVATATVPRVNMMSRLLPPAADDARGIVRTLVEDWTVSRRLDSERALVVFGQPLGVGRGRDRPVGQRVRAPRSVEGRCECVRHRSPSPVTGRRRWTAIASGDEEMGFGEPGARPHDLLQPSQTDLE